LADLTNGQVAVRNSRFPAGELLIFPRTELARFLSGAKAGEFDNLVE
jgi:hypothetical protein